jgi:hypothetical protein
MARDTRPDVAGDRPFWARQRPRYLISGFAKCGACGSSSVKISRNLFGCAAARNKGTCTNRLNIRIQVLEDAVLAGLKSRLMDADLFKEFCQEYHREVNRLRSEENATLDGQKAELARIERRTLKLVELITEDDAPVKALKAKLKVLEVRQAELERALAVATAPAPLIHPNLAEVYRQKVVAMHEALHDAGSRDEAFDVIRSLIDEVRLVPVDGELRIEIRGERASWPASSSSAWRAPIESPAVFRRPGWGSKSRWLRGLATSVTCTWSNPQLHAWPPFQAVTWVRFSSEMPGKSIR